MESEKEDDQMSQNTQDELSQVSARSKKSSKQQQSYSTYEIGKMILKSDALTKDIQKTKQVPKIYTNEQVKELDDVSMIEVLQQKQRELYENVNVGSKIDVVLKYQQDNLKKIQPGNLAKLVGQAVVAQDLHNQALTNDETQDDEPQASVELQTEHRSQHDNTKLDITASTGDSQELRAFKASDFIRMHKAQQEVLGKLPVVDHQTNNFAPKVENKETIAHNQLLKEYLQTFPSNVVTHITNYSEFKKMIKEGSLLNYYDMQTIVSLIQNKLIDSEYANSDLQNSLTFGNISDFKLRNLDQSSAKTDIYGKLYRSLKQKFGNPFIYDKDNVRRSLDYQVNEQIDEKEALQFLESEDGFKPPENTTIFVDELAKIAKRYGESYGAYLDRVEADLQFRRQCTMSILKGHQTYENTMKKRAAELSTEAESQILKMALQRNDPPLDYEMEMRLQDIPEAHVGFLEEILLKYVSEEAEQGEDVRKKLALQALQQQYNQQIFRSPGDYLEYVAGPVLDEDLIELNVSFDPDPPLQPAVNPEFEYFVTEKEEQKHTQASKRIAKFFSTEKIPLAKQIELFEIAAENMDKVEEIGDKLKQINEGTDEKVKNAALTWFLKYLNIDIAQWIKAAEQQAQEDADRNQKLTMSNRLGTQLQLDVSSTNIFGGMETPRGGDTARK